MTTRAILVTGDFVLDHHIYEGRRYHYAACGEEGVTWVTELGGAALVHRLLGHLLARDEPPAATSHLAIDEAAVHASIRRSPREAGLAHAYAFWRRYPTGAARERQSWRVGEAMGFGAAERSRSGGGWAPADPPPTSPDGVVISEGGVGFRDLPEFWGEEHLDAARWVVLKTTAPIAVGPLWNRLTSAHADKLVVIVAARELRQSAARISAGLSWERSVGDLLRELDAGGALSALRSCRHLIVTFDSEGAAWIDLGGGSGERAAMAADTPVRLLYDPAVIEGDHAHVVQGSAYGFSSCLTATVAWQLARDLEGPDLVAAIEAGLCAKRDLRERGHGPAAEPPSGFPAPRLARAAAKPAYLYSRAAFPAGAAVHDSEWSLVRHSQPGDGPVHDLGRLVVLRGLVALANLPHVRIGAFLSADWHEIESLRSLVQIMRRYQAHDAGKKPLSIGVFGPPGAGKSFAVRELARHVVSDSAWLEFNLSQFSGPGDLTGAFHQVRDSVLQGKLPVAFFDEFDSQSYRWLKHLLAPMQDGHFQEGQLTHAIGKCIMVFAGGTSWTFETFGAVEASEGAGGEADGEREFRLAKGPDFKSRLDGYLNVVGPNRRQARPGVASEDFDDIHVPLRRALMIRAVLRCTPDEKLEIDDGLLHALLGVERYTHGARSLAKILGPFAAVRPEPLRRSSLLPFAQLDMHVSADAFLDLCAEAPTSPYPPGDSLTDQQVTAVAPAIHETYRALGRREGWLDPALDADYDDLPDFYQRSNRAAAERMLSILGLVGLRLDPGEATAEEERALRDELEYFMEALAEAEHDGWMQWHLAQGWRHGPEKDADKKEHPCLEPFISLPKLETDKDRDTIRHYPDFARTAGMKIVR